MGTIGMKGEILYPLESVNAYITDKLEVYPMLNNKPNLDMYYHIDDIASEWIGKISKDDANLVSELIYWNERNG